MSSSSSSVISSEKQLPLQYVKSIFSTMILLGIVILVGSATLYSCRVSQSNILPTDLNCYPYTSTISKPTSIEIDVNVVYNADTDTTMSEKINFPFDENITGKHSSFIVKYIAYLCKKINSQETFPLFAYFLSILNQSLHHSILVLDTCYGFLNSSLSESVIVFSGLFSSIFIWIFVFIVNLIYTYILWITQLIPFLPSFSYLVNPTNWLNIFIQFILGIFLCPIVLFTPLISLGHTFISILFPLTMKAKKEGTNKPYGISNMFLDILYFKKNIILWIFSLLFFIQSYSTYGIYAALVLLFVCVCLYFFTSIYKSAPVSKESSKMNDNFEKAFKQLCKKKTK